MAETLPDDGPDEDDEYAAEDRAWGKPKRCSQTPCKQLIGDYGYNVTHPDGPRLPSLAEHLMWHAENDPDDEDE